MCEVAGWYQCVISRNVEQQFQQQAVSIAHRPKANTGQLCVSLLGSMQRKSVVLILFKAWFHVQ